MGTDLADKTRRTLLIPAFVAPLILWRRPLRSTVVSIVMLGTGMIVTVGPYVARNYLVTGKPVVTAQGGYAFWGTSD